MNAPDTMPAKPAIPFEQIDGIALELKALKQALLDFADRHRGRDGVDQRWLAIGVTDVEKGCMSIAHAVMTSTLEKGLAQLQQQLHSDG